MIFEILAKTPDGSSQRVYLYDNQTSVLTDKETGNVFEYPNAQVTPTANPSAPFSSDIPLKKVREISVLKIQLGLSCNYSCEYCSQRFVERAPETSKKHIEEFMTKLSTLNFDEQRGLKVEFWGGEPLVYWKTLVPLLEALKEKFSSWKQKPRYSMITNGSLINEEVTQWIIENHLYMAISHDGPGQAVRGPDPFEDPKKKELILNLYRVLTPHNRISFNSMLHTTNLSRTAIRDWFIKLTGDPWVRLGEGALIDAYDEGGMKNSLETKAQRFAFRQQTFNELIDNGPALGFPMIWQKVEDFKHSVLSHSDAEAIGQKCGMENPSHITVDLHGNVLTCQNVSAVEVGPNGESHNGGNLDAFDAVELKAGTHWKEREHCRSCPVLHICQGACLFLAGDLWETSCNNAYSDAITIFAAGFLAMTGMIPMYIVGEDLPDDRRDIWGLFLEHKEQSKKKIIPIKAAQEPIKVTNINE